MVYRIERYSPWSWSHTEVIPKLNGVSLWWSFRELRRAGRGGGEGQAGLNFPLPVPCTLGSSPLSLWSLPLYIFSIMKNCASCEIYFLSLLARAPLGYSVSRPLLSRLPQTSRPHHDSRLSALCPPQHSS